MPINYDSSVTGVNTPQAITGPISDRPAVTDVAEGTIYISFDTQEIYTAKGGNWILISSITGSAVGNLAQTLGAGNYAMFQQINLGDALNPNYSNIQFDGIQYTLNTFIEAGNKGTITAAVHDSNEININYKYVDDFTTNEQYYIENKIRSGYANIVAGYVSGTGGGVFNYADTYVDSNGSLLRTFYSNIPFDVRTQTAAQSSQTQSQLTCFFGNWNNTNYCFIGFISSNQNPIIQSYFYPSTTNYQLQFRNSETLASGNQYSFELPVRNGILANVNEPVRDGNVDLSFGNFDADKYGVYVVTTGSTTNKFMLANFVTNGQNGQFITLCVADTRVDCTNTAGNIYGTANINSKGLYKLMKIGNDIYSSHI